MVNSSSTAVKVKNSGSLHPVKKQQQHHQQQTNVQKKGIEKLKATKNKKKGAKDDGKVSLNVAHHRRQTSSTKENQKVKLNKTTPKVSPKNIGNSSSDVVASNVNKSKNQQKERRVPQFKLKRLSPALAAICGKKKMTRQHVVSRMWTYIKKRQLQDPSHKTTILCDEKLRAVTQRASIGQTDMLLCIGPHLTDIN